MLNNICTSDECVFKVPASPEKSDVDTSADKVEKSQTLEILGADGNTHTTVVEQSPNQPPTLATKRPGTPKANETNNMQAFEALGSIDLMQQQLL